MPYAVKGKYYVIFADGKNTDRVKNIVAGAEDLIIFGQIHSDVIEALAPYDPEVIGKGEDRYADNLLIVDKMIEEYGMNSVILDRGLALEPSMYAGNRPIVLTGRIVPKVTEAYLREKFLADDIRGSLVVDRKMVISMQSFRDDLEDYYFDQTGEQKDFGVLIKFGQASAATGEEVRPLDIFPLPAYVPELSIDEVVFNPETKQVEIIVANVGDGSARYTNELTVSVNGNALDTVSDDGVNFIESGEKLGTEYDVDLDNVDEGNITASVICRYGRYEDALDNFDYWDGPLLSVTYEDNSNLSIKGGRYDAENNLLLITVKNHHNESAFFRNTITLSLDGEQTSLKGNTKAIDGSSLMIDEFPLEMSEEDLKANENITVDMKYGAREGYLKKEDRYNVALKEDGLLSAGLLYTVLPIALILLLLIAVILWYMRKKKNEKRRE
jgi:hypothetical protein